MDAKANYKKDQAEKKKRMCLQYSGPKTKDEKKLLITEGNFLYGWDKQGIKKLGVRVNGRDYTIGREAANKKERKKQEQGLAYRDKKGVVAKDERRE